MQAVFEQFKTGECGYKYDGETEYKLVSLIEASMDDELFQMMHFLEMGYDVNFHIPHSSGYDTPLHHAVRNGSLPAVKLLLAHGADMYIPCGWEGATPFCLSFLLGHLDIAEYFIDKYANVDDAHSESSTPAIVYAAVNDFHDGVKLLLRHRADINLQASDGCSALYYANYHGHYDLASFLVENGATE